MQVKNKKERGSEEDAEREKDRRQSVQVRVSRWCGRERLSEGRHTVWTVLLDGQRPITQVIMEGLEWYSILPI